jgi:Surp module
MVEFVVREGPMFEAMIMNRELQNPMFRYLTFLLQLKMWFVNIVFQVTASTTLLSGLVPQPPLIANKFLCIVNNLISQSKRYAGT